MLLPDFFEVIMKRVVLALCAVSALSTPALSLPGYFMTGNDAYPLCTSQSVAEINVCTGLIMGFADAGRYYGHDLWLQVCLPYEVPSAQVRAVYTKHLQDNPANLHHSAMALFMDAMIAAFPC